MNLKDNYLLYATAYHLVTDDEYELLHINDQIKEIWLHKYENKTSKVIRLTSQGFDWKNQLRKDIAQVFQKMKVLKRYLSRKKVEINNIYISKLAPVDDWEVLKRPMMLKEKNPIQMNVFYLDDDDFEGEKQRLHDKSDIDLVESSVDKTETELEDEIKEIKVSLGQLVSNRRKEEESIFSYGKPMIVYLLLAFNILMYFVLTLNGGSESINTLIKFGAKYNPSILVDGEWWRIVSSMFLHIGILHLFMNLVAVYYLGTLVERIFGSFRFLIIYMLAGIGGGLASFAFSMSISAGASGALFGLFGALIFFGLIYKRLFFETIGVNLLILIVINLVFGFIAPQIDNAAHLGGLIFGFIAATIVYLPTKKHRLKQASAFLIYIALISLLVIFGIQENEKDPSYQLALIDDLIKQEEYEEIVDITTAILEKPGDLKAPLLFQRSYAYIELDKINLAIDDLENSIKLENDRSESFYNLALLYDEKGQNNKAKEAIEEAYNLNPKNKEYIELYETITGEKTGN